MPLASSNMSYFQTASLTSNTLESLTLETGTCWETLTYTVSNITGLQMCSWLQGHDTITV